MPLYDYECKRCGSITEKIRSFDDKIISCPKCNNGVAVRIMSSSKVNTANDDAEWIRSVTEVVEKGTDKPHCNEFLKNPTRTNLREWMKGEGLRHMDPNEGKKKPVTEREERAADLRTVNTLMRKKKARERIVVRGY